MSTLCIGYDVECMDPASDITARFLTVAARLHAELGAPATLYLVGITAQNNADAVRQALASAPFELGTHTYSHVLLKTLCQSNSAGVTVIPAGSFERIAREIDLGCRVLREQFSVECRALTAPYGCYRGLSDRPDLLHLLHAAGIRICRTWMRNEQDWVPVGLNLQPFWYAPQGFPDMLEFPTTGRHDCNWSEHYGFEPRRFASPGEFLGYLKSELDEVHTADGVWTATQHDTTTVAYDPEMTIMRGLIEHARGIGMEVISHGELYDRLAGSGRGETDG